MRPRCSNQIEFELCVPLGRLLLGHCSSGIYICPVSNQLSPRERNSGLGGKTDVLVRLISWGSP